MSKKPLGRKAGQQRFFQTLLCCALCLLSAACAPSGRQATDRAEASGFAPRLFRTSTFTLFGLLRPARGGDGTLHVYVEGDGYAWVRPNRPSADPTPRNPVGLSLAQADPNANAVLYLARPCQYVSGAQARMCAPKYWTSARLAPPVLQALDEAVSEAKNRAGARAVALIGYSGGGGAAALLAARRPDVIFLGTVAGNLDHKAWTALHKVSPMTESLNPLDAAPALRALRQRHMSGGRDTVMPPSISRNFCAALRAAQACVTVAPMEHDGPWAHVWDFDYSK